MKNQIFPCLWFDGKAKEAATFYCSIFNHSKIITDSPMVVKFEIEGKVIMGLNGGPMFKINPSISLFVTCTTENEIETLWNKLSAGGSAMMPLDKYPWSEKYGWLVDQYGMSWQLMLGELADVEQKIIPSFLFVGEQFGKAQEAIKTYTAIFPGSRVHDMQFYESGDPQAGNVKFGHFDLQKTSFAAMDGMGEHAFQFNEGVSLVVECDTQQEIDNYWQKLTRNGQESMCGWLKDEFGVCWQIVPRILGSLMTDPDKSGRVMQEIMKMKKLDIGILQNA